MFKFNLRNLFGRQPHRRLVGTLDYKVAAYNDITGSVIGLTEHLYFYRDDAGNRFVGATDPALKKQPAAVEYLANGKLPNGCVISA